jgi:hypothetical protein
MGRKKEEWYLCECSGCEDRRSCGHYNDEEPKYYHIDDLTEKVDGGYMVYSHDDHTGQYTICDICYRAANVDYSYKFEEDDGRFVNICEKCTEVDGELDEFGVDADGYKYSFEYAKWLDKDLFTRSGYFKNTRRKYDDEGLNAERLPRPKFRKKVLDV